MDRVFDGFCVEESYLGMMFIDEALRVTGIAIQVALALTFTKSRVFGVFNGSSMDAIGLGLFAQWDVSAVRHTLILPTMVTGR